VPHWVRFMTRGMIRHGMTSYHSEHGEQVAAQRVASVFLNRLNGRYDVAHAILFGSRARGGHRPDSDLDLAIVLNGPPDDFIDAKLDMAGLAFDVMMEIGVLVQPFPLWNADLAHPEKVAESRPAADNPGGRHPAGMTKEIMDKAATALASAKILLEAGDADGATNRAYYAMFDAALAAISRAGAGSAPDRPKTHGELIASFGLHLVRAGLLEPAMGRSLNRLQELRLTGDYFADPVPMDQAKRGGSGSGHLHRRDSGMLDRSER